MTKVPAEDIRRGDGWAVIERVEALCTVTKDGFAARSGDPLVLRGWQKQLLLRLFARRGDGRLRHRVALIGLPRKDGKSALASALALDGLIFGGNGAEVYSAAAEKEQARIVFGETKKMIASNPDLAELCTPMRDVIEVPSTGSIYRVLSAEAYSKEGLNISRAIIDELHAHPTDDLFNVLTLASAARVDPLVIAITTAGVMTGRDGRDSVCYRLFKHGKDIAAGSVVDPSFFMAWWGAPDGADHQDPAVWEAANPGFGDLIDPDDFASAVLRTPENEFRTKRLNQWVAAVSAWLPAGAWEARYDPSASFDRGDKVVLGFDGSFSNDSTALVAAKCSDPPVVTVLRAWEKPDGADPDWRVPIQDVEDEIRAACKRFQVREIVCDPYRWARSLQVLADERLPVVEYPQSPQRMVPATQRFYEAVLNGGVVHDGNEILGRHLRNCVVKTDSRGTRVTKEAKSSDRKIDAAVAAIMAFDVAAVPGNRHSAKDWLESLAPPCLECGQPNPAGSACCSKCNVALSGVPEPAEAPAAPQSVPPDEKPWTPWGQTTEPRMLPQTQAALNVLQAMRAQGRM